MDDPLIRKTYGLRASLLRKIEDYRFGLRINPGAEVVRRAIKRGIEVLESEAVRIARAGAQQ